MRYCFFLSTLGGSPLQCGLERGLRQLGHEVTYYGSHAAYDVLVVFNQCAHTLAYVYPDFPHDWRGPVAFVDSAEYGWGTRFPGRAHLFANGFTPAAMGHDTRVRSEQQKLRNFLEGRSFPYFIREHLSCIDYPASYHPIDYPLYASSVCLQRPDRAEYLRRPRDLFVSWGASHPWRWPITHALRAASPHSEVHVVEEVVCGRPTPRMHQEAYFQKTREAKCSVSYDGYGSGSFRRTEVLVRTVLLDGPLAIRTRAPLIDGETCVKYEMTAQGDECTGTNIADKLREVLADPERSYGIYERGYDHCMTHLTEAATARSLVETIERHDWGVATPLEVV